MKDYEMIPKVKTKVKGYLSGWGFYTNKSSTTAEMRVLDAYQQHRLQTKGRKSSLLWTTHKCASTLISRVFSEIEKEYNIKGVSTMLLRFGGGNVTDW